MSEEIGQAIQIIRVGYDGIEIAMKVGSGSIETMKKAVDFLVALIDREKAMGQTSMRKLLMKGGDLQVFQFDTKDLKKVEKMVKKYGILYSVLPDINKGDGKSEIIFHAEAVPRVNMMVQKLNSGRIASFDDYLKNGDEKELEKVLSFLKKQKEGNDVLHTAEAVKAGDMIEGLIEKVGFFAMEKQTIRVEEIQQNFKVERNQAEKVAGQLEKMGVLSSEENGERKVLMDKEAFQNRIHGYQELVERMRTTAFKQKEGNVVDITITKKLIQEENDHAIKTRIPGTWGKDVRYLWLDKEKTTEIHNGKTMLSFLDMDKDYKVYSEDNRVVEIKRGRDLYDGHYDPVAAEVRKRYKEADRKAKITKQKAPTPKRR